MDLKQVLREEISRPEKESHFIWPEGLDVRDEGLQSRLRTVMEKTILKSPWPTALKHREGLRNHII